MDSSNQVDGERHRGPIDVRGKVALITRGDERIGFNLAIDFVKRGCRVLLAGNQLADVKQACSSIWRAASSEIHQVSSREANSKNSDGSNYVRAVKLDLTGGEEEVNAGVEEAWSCFGVIDILVYCSSVPGELNNYEAIEEKYWDLHMTSSLKGGWILSKALAKKMLSEGKGGSMIFMASVEGAVGLYPGVSVFATSMAATNHLVKVMALEFGKYAIRVNAISCGLDQSATLLKSFTNEIIQKKALEAVPVKRWANVQTDFSGVVLWLASDCSAYTTGSIITIDGGQSLVRPRMRSFI